MNVGPLNKVLSTLQVKTFREFWEMTDSRPVKNISGGTVFKNSRWFWWAARVYTMSELQFSEAFPFYQSVFSSLHGQMLPYSMIYSWSFRIPFVKSFYQTDDIIYSFFFTLFFRVLHMLSLNTFDILIALYLNLSCI